MFKELILIIFIINTAAAKVIVADNSTGIKRSIASESINIVLFDEHEGNEDFKSYDVQQARFQPSQMPAVDLIDYIFEEVGISEYTNSMDQLDKDILFRRAQVKSIQELIDLYPKLPKDLLIDLSKRAKRVE